MTVPVVELAPPPTGDVGEHAVEHLPSLLVEVETQVEQLSEEATALRDPECEDLVVGFSQVGAEVAHCEQTGADDWSRA